MRLLISDEALGGLLRDYISRSDNASGSDLAKNREQATDYYLGRIEGRETTDGLSDQLSGDVADMMDAISAEVAINLLNTDQISEITAEGTQDTVGARVESAVVNKVIMEQNPGFEILSAGVQAAGLYKNGIVAVEASEIERQRTRFVGQVAGDQRSILIGETGGEIDDDGNLTWTETQKRAILRNVANENWFTENEYPGWSLQNTGFCAERIYYPRGDLMDLGYPWEVVKDLQAVSTSSSGTSIAGETTRRYPDQASTSNDQIAEESELIETFWCYVRLPVAGHKLRLHKIHLAGLTDETILDKQPVDFIPYAQFKLIPFIGRNAGVSIHDRIKPVEDGKTYALRQWEDNLAYGNNAELVIGGNSTDTEHDAQNRIPGGYLRAPVVTDVAPLPVQDMGSNTKLYLDQMDKVRSERGGSAMDMQRADAQLMKGANNVGSMGVGLLLGAAEQRSAWYARNLAETGFRQVFLLVHETLRRFEMDPVGVWVMGEFVQVDTRQFREREAVNIRSGMSSSERVRRIQALDHTIQTQVSVMQVAGPGVLSDLSGLHQAVMDRDKAAGIDSPQRYWLDPQSQKSLQAQQANAQNSDQQQQLASQLEQADKQIEAQKIQLDKYKHDTQLKFDYDELAQKTEIEEAKIVGDAVTKLEVAAIGGRQDQNGSGSLAGQSPGAAPTAA